MPFIYEKAKQRKTLWQANKALKKVCSEDGHRFQDNGSDFFCEPPTNQSYQCIMIIYTSIGLVHTLLGPSLTTLLVQCSTRVVERILSNKVRIRRQIFKKGGQQGRVKSHIRITNIPSFTTCQFTHG